MASGAFAQDVPAPPPLRGDAASIKDTLKFLQAKLPSKVNFLLYVHNNVTGGDAKPVQGAIEISRVSSDEGSCLILYHAKSEGPMTVDAWGKVSLKRVTNVTLMQFDQLLQQNLAKGGHPEAGIKIDPPVYLVLAQISDEDTPGMFPFYDSDLADRVSRALHHAVDLCGGGNQDPF